MRPGKSERSETRKVSPALSATTARSTKPRRSATFVKLAIFSILMAFTAAAFAVASSPVGAVARFGMVDSVKSLMAIVIQEMSNLELVELEAQTLDVTAPFSSATDHFRSAATGNWNSATTWESSPTGADPWTVATLVPDSTANTITIRVGHTVTISASG